LANLGQGRGTELAGLEARSQLGGVLIALKQSCLPPAQYFTEQHAIIFVAVVASLSAAHGSKKPG
jgi:hypothetical protein